MVTARSRISATVWLTVAVALAFGAPAAASPSGIAITHVELLRSQVAPGGSVR